MATIKINKNEKKEEKKNEKRSRARERVEKSAFIHSALMSM